MKKTIHPEMPTEQPKGIAPPPPPTRTFSCLGWGMIETKESKQATENWKSYIQGFGEGLAAGRHKLRAIKGCNKIS